MTRKPRIEFKGCLYHVITKGNNGDFILEKAEDKLMYLHLIQKYKERYPFKLYAYCIMDNHVHLLIEQEEMALSKIMQGIQQSYTQKFNKKYERTGHVFQQRYRAEICNKESYLLHLIRYIHNNPCKAGLEGGLNYRWSSHKIYIGNADSELVDIEYILKHFSDDKRRSVSKYKDFMNIKGGNYEDGISEYLLEDFQYHTNEEITKSKEHIDEIILKICNMKNIGLQDLTKKSKIRTYSEIRKAIVLISDKYSETTVSELAMKLNIPVSMVSKIKSGISKRTDDVDQIIREFEEKEKKKA